MSRILDKWRGAFGGAPEAARAERLGGVQCLRAIAALLVLASHIRFVEATYAPDAVLPLWLDWGGIGVDLFFAISGFIMVYVTRGAFGRGRSAALFLYNRATRIYPALWLFTILIAAGAYVLAGSPDWLTWEGFASSMLLFPADDQPALAVAWSLIHEVYFYLMFALFLLGPARLLPLWLALWAGAVLLADATAWPLAAANPWTRLVLHPLTLEFIMGCIVGLLVCSGRRRFGPACIVLGAGGMALGSAGLIHGLGSALPVDARVLMVGVPAALLVYGVATLEADHGWRAPRAGVALGDWSYSLYLSHMLTAATLGKFLSLLGVPGAADNLLWIAVTAIACVAAAGIAYYGFERAALRLAARGRRRLFGEAAKEKRTGAASRIW